MSLLLPSCEEIQPESLPVSDTVSLLESDMTTSESFLSDETVDITSHCDFSLKKYHLPHIFEVAFIDKFYSNALNQFPSQSTH